MTMMPPPRSGRRGLLLLRDNGQSAGDELRESWTQTLQEMVLSLPATATKPTPAFVVNPGSDVGGFDAGEKIQAAVSELGLRLCARRIVSVDKADTRISWSIDANGVSLVEVPQPTAQEAIDASEALFRPPPPPPLAGFKGQRNWVAIYFTHHLGLDTGAHLGVLELLDAALNVVLLPVFTIKNTARIQRPWVLDPRLTTLPIDRLLWHSSFPSGHATSAYACARFLAKVVGADANLRSNLNKLAELIATNREKGLVHTALDTAAGQAIGEHLGEWLYTAATTDRLIYPVWASMHEWTRRALSPPGP